MDSKRSKNSCFVIRAFRFVFIDEMRRNVTRCNFLLKWLIINAQFQKRCKNWRRKSAKMTETRIAQINTNFQRVPVPAAQIAPLKDVEGQADPPMVHNRSHK